MSTQHHTPGPWILDATPVHCPCSFVIRAKSDACAALTPVATIHNDMHVEANARLIAAAPELFDALQAITASYDRLLAKYNKPHEWGTIESDNARAAIAKAVGA